MKLTLLAIFACLLLASCHTTKDLAISAGNYTDGYNSDTLILQSLFTDKASTISEDNIQKVLDGTYKLPGQLRIAIVKLESPGQRQFYWNDENYLKTQQSYIDLFTEKLKQSARVNKVSVIPDLLLSKAPSFTSIREAAVRMQADVVIVYSISSDIYTKYRFLSKTDIKAFATTQLIMLDIRTGLVPFSSIVTKDILSQKKAGELDESETRGRIKNEAVLLTIQETGQKLTAFLQ